MGDVLDKQRIVICRALLLGETLNTHRMEAIQDISTDPLIMDVGKRGMRSCSALVWCCCSTSRSKKNRRCARL